MMSLFLYRFPFTSLFLFRYRFRFRFRFQFRFLFLFPFPFLFRIPVSGFRFPAFPDALIKAVFKNLCVVKALFCPLDKGHPKLEIFK